MIWGSITNNLNAKHRLQMIEMENINKLDEKFRRNALRLYGNGWQSISTALNVTLFTGKQLYIVFRNLIPA